MRLLKREKDALVAVAGQNFDSAEDFIEAMVKELDRLRGERTHVYACSIVAGIPLTIGPLATRNQAEKALSRLGVAPGKAWVVPGWTAEGWENHMRELDTPPPPNQTEQWKGGAFWGRVSEIREGERSAITGKSKQDIEIKRLVV